MNFKQYLNGEFSREDKKELELLATRIKPIVKFTNYDYDLVETKIEEKTLPNGTVFEKITYKRVWTESDKPKKFDEEILKTSKEASKNAYLGYIKAGKQIFNCAVDWDPKFLCKNPNPEFLCKTPKLFKLAQITTLHTYNYYGLFKPTEAEVLTQIPKNMIDEVDVYKINFDSNPEKSFSRDGKYHEAHVDLYKLAKGEQEPQEVTQYYEQRRAEIEEKYRGM